MKLVPDIIGYYELEFKTQKFKTTDPIWQSEIIKTTDLDKTAKTKDAKIS